MPTVRALTSPPIPTKSRSPNMRGSTSPLTSWATLAYMPRSSTPADRRTQATSGPAMWSSIFVTTSTPHRVLSGLYHAASTLSVYASPPGSPSDHATLDSGWWPALTGQGSHLLDRIEGFRHVYPATCLPLHQALPGAIRRTHGQTKRLALDPHASSLRLDRAPQPRDHQRLTPSPARSAIDTGPQTGDARNPAPPPADAGTNRPRCDFPSLWTRSSHSTETLTIEQLIGESCQRRCRRAASPQGERRRVGLTDYKACTSRKQRPHGMHGQVDVPGR